MPLLINVLRFFAFNAIGWLLAGAGIAFATYQGFSFLNDQIINFMQQRFNSIDSSILNLFFILFAICLNNLLNPKIKDKNINIKNHILIILKKDNTPNNVIKAIEAKNRFSDFLFNSTIASKTSSEILRSSFIS